MRVTTLHREAFAAACSELRKLVVQSGFEADILVGIPRGGDFVAAAFRHPHTYSAGKQRPSTKRKGQTFKNIVARLPRSVNDLLRRGEHTLRQLRGAITGVRAADVSLPADLTEVLGRGACRVLVVDDAVDSGSTLAGVVESIRRAQPLADVRSAVITVTWRKPLIIPDFRLYYRRLVRFPWSADSTPQS